MSSKFDRAIEVVLKWEGGYVNHPADPGGATNHGISLRYARTRGSMFDLDGDGDVDAADMQLVTVDQAKGVYRDWFWRDVRGDEMPSGVDLMMVDYAVNSGPGRAIKALQTVLGVPVDGVLGPQTMAALAAKGNDLHWVIDNLRNERFAFLRSLGSWNEFGNGWTNRVEDVSERAHQLVGAPNMTVAEAAQTNSATAAATVGTISVVVTSLAQTEPFIKALGGLSPVVGVAVVIALAVAGIIWWRRSKPV